MSSSVTAVPLRHVWDCMGTVFSVDVRGAGVDRSAVEQAVAWTHWVDETFSTYRPSSVVSRLARGDLGRRAVSAEVREVLDHCDSLQLMTGGYFSSTASGVLDPSGYVKGWAIGRVSSMLEEGGSTAHCVNGGGDVQCLGESAPDLPWRVGLAHPLQPNSYVSVVSGFGPLAVATSGGAERGAHIVDPLTGHRPTALASVSLVGTEIARVDALATACVAMGLDCLNWIGQWPELRAVVVTGTGQVLTTANWAD